MKIVTKDNINDVLSEFEMIKKIKTHNILPERVELYRDFVINLTHYVFDSYLGGEYIKTDEDITGHFKWCFYKVVSEFEEQEISFRENTELYEYFSLYFYNQFYRLEKIPAIGNYVKFWDQIFDLKSGIKSKNKKTFEVLIELYEIFDKSLLLKNKCHEAYS